MRRAAVSAAAAWRIAQLNHEQQAIDRRILDVEARLRQPQNPSEADPLITQLRTYEEAAEKLQRTLLYRFGGHETDFVTNEISLSRLPLRGPPGLVQGDYFTIHDGLVGQCRQGRHNRGISAVEILVVR